MIRFGPYFYPTGLKPEITITFKIIDDAANMFAIYDVILSSAIDRKHGDKSLHYPGMAIDIYWDHFTDTPIDVRANLVHELRYRLGAHYDVVLEADHIHVEYQPKTAVNEHWRT